MNKVRHILIAIVLGAALLTGGLVYLWFASGGDRLAPQFTPATAPASGASATPAPEIASTIEPSPEHADLPAPNALAISVRDLLDRPIRDAQIILTRNEKSTASQQHPITLNQKSEDQLEIPSIPHGMWHWRAEAENHQPAEGEFNFQPDNAALIIFLNPMNPPLRGIVADGDDMPLPGINILASNARSNEHIDSGVSDASGAFILLGMPPQGMVRLVPVESERPRDPVFVTLPHREDIRLRVIPDGAITGRIIDASGRPMTRAMSIRVEEFDAAAPSPNHMRAEDSGGGLFQILIRPGRYHLHIDANDGYVDIDSITIRPGQTVDLGDVALNTQGASLQASIVRGDPPRPLPGVRASLIQHQSPGAPRIMQRVVNGDTDGHGQFKAAGLPAGKYILTLSHEYPLHRELQFDPGENKIIEIVMPALSMIEGRVVAGGDRAPVAGAHVVWQQQGGFDDGDAIASSRSKSTVSDTDGQFTIPDVWPQSPFRFQVNAEGWAAKVIELTPTREREWIDVVLTEEGSVLNGLVVDEHKKGLKANVTLSAEGLRAPAPASMARKTWQAQCNEDGRFVFESVPLDQQLKITATIEGYQPSSIQLNGVPKDPIVLTLRRAPGLRLQVVHADRSPVNGKIEVYSHTEMKPFLILSQEIINGQLQWDSFAHFGIPIEFRHKNERARRTFYPGEGDVVEDFVILSPSSRLIVRTLGPDGAALAGANVTITSSYGTGTSEEKTTNAGGEAIFDALPGEYSIWASHPEYLGRGDTAMLPATGSKTVTIRFEDGPQLEIQVVEAATGLGVAQAPVTLTTDQGGNLLDTITDESGVAVFRALPPGAYGARVLLAPGVFLSQGGILFEAGQGVNQRAFIAIPPLHQIIVRFLRGSDPISGSGAYLTPRPGTIDLAPNQTLRTAAQTDHRGEVHWSVPAAEYEVVLLPPDFTDTLHVMPGDDGREFEFNLAPHLVTVKVLSAEDDEPLNQISVVLYQIPLEGSVSKWGSDLKTDPTGQAIFSPPFDGFYKIAITPQNNFDLWESPEFELSPSHTQHYIEAALTKKKRPVGQLVLRMVDELSQTTINEPIGNFLIWDYNTGDWCYMDFHFTMPENGVVDISNFPHGYFWAQLLTPHYISEKVTFLMPEDQGMAINLRGARKASARITVDNLPADFDHDEAFPLTLYDPIDRKTFRDAQWARVDIPTGPFRPGFYYYQFYLPGVGPFDGLVELLAGETAGIAITLDALPDQTPAETPTPVETPGEEVDD